MVAVGLAVLAAGDVNPEVFAVGGLENQLIEVGVVLKEVEPLTGGFEVGMPLVDVINFMDGINGITAGYSLAVLVPLALVNGSGFLDEPSDKVERMVQGSSRINELENSFIDQSYLIVAIIGVLVFSIFNFRPKGKAKCFAGDVGSVGIGFIMLFAIGRLIMKTGDVTWLVLLLVYGVDGILTICHRVMLHEHIGQAHRKHAYQIMANELKIGHMKISLLYMGLQLAVSLGFIYLCPNTVLAHWVYLVGDRNRVGNRLHFVYAEVLSFARGVPSWVKG